MRPTSDLPQGWRRLLFPEAIDFQEGPGILARDFRPAGVPLIRLAGLDVGVELLKGCNFLDPEMVARRWSHFRVEAGDVLLSTSASLGRIAVVDELSVGAILYTGLIRMRCRDCGVSPDFIPYLLKSPYFQEQIEAQGAGSVIRHFGPSHLRTMTVLVPPLGEQHAITAVLGCIERKIALNRRMNRTLEVTAAALFRKWCDDNRSSMTAMRAETLIKCGVLLITDGYRAKNSEMAESGLPFARAGNLQGHFDFTGADLLNELSVLLARDKVSQPFDCVFTSKGTVGRIAQVLPSTPRFVYSPQLCFWRALRPDVLNPFILNQWMNGEEFREQIDAVKGQTDMADYVSLRDQRRMQITLPCSVDQGPVSARLEAMARLQDSNNAESATLAKLRDTLLPQLLSGAIRLRDAERAVASAV